MYSLIMENASFDFGYEWYLHYSHLLVGTICGLLALLVWRLRWSRVVTIILAAGALWGLTGAWIIRDKINLNSPDRMPTQSFLPSGTGRVLDLGAGSGRTTLMVLEARPQARVVSLDKFAQGFGIEPNTPQQLRSNLRAAGVDSQVDISEADMRKIPYDAESFDAAVSAFAMDHLGRQAFDETLAEVTRVLRPGGQLLFMTINRDIWVRIAFPFLHGHGYFGKEPAPDRWRRALTSTGLEVVEMGTQPATLYILCRKQ